METYEFTIDAASTDIGTRLDKYLTEQIPDQSRSYIQKLLDDNFITVNGKSAKSNYKLRAGDTITVEIPEAEELDIEPENIPLQPKIFRSISSMRMMISLSSTNRRAWLCIRHRDIQAEHSSMP